MSFFCSVARCSLLVVGLAGCFDSEDYDCSSDTHVARVQGDLVFSESDASLAEVEASWKTWFADAGADDDAGGYGAPERTVLHVGDSPTDGLVVDQPCLSAHDGCISIGAPGELSLTFERPAAAGTYDLRTLDARVCEHVTFLASQGPARAYVRCSKVEGELLVREIAAPCPTADPIADACARLDADLTLVERAADRDGPGAAGRAHLLVRTDHVERTCSGTGSSRSSGCGQGPMAPHG